jgi:C-terminal peptidase prc
VHDSVPLLVTAVVAAVAAALLPSPVLAQSGARGCSIVAQNLFVRDVLDEYYLWYRELPLVDPVRFARPEAYLDAVRYRPLDLSFSYVASRAAEAAFFEESRFIGFGFSTQRAGSELRVLQVFPESPAAEAGMGRGDRILEVNGRSVERLIAEGEIDAVFGPSREGVSATLRLQSRDGIERRVTLTKRIVTIPTVSLARVFHVDGRRVGYLLFRNFVRPSYEALDEAFGVFGAAGVTELVLDLRYNGGGLVDVAVHLASLIGGAPVAGRLFASFRHNDKNRALDRDLRFEETPRQALHLARLVVITTRASASASELLINSLRPYIPVISIGAPTFGKPVGQYGFEFCDKVLAPVSFVLLNARGEADYFGGLPVDCPAADDLEHDLGSPDEASLAEALSYIRTGACSTPPRAFALGAMSVQPGEDGWQLLLNAR